MKNFIAYAAVAALALAFATPSFAAPRAVGVAVSAGGGIAVVNGINHDPTAVAGGISGSLSVANGKNSGATAGGSAGGHASATEAYGFLGSYEKASAGGGASTNTSACAGRGC